MTYIFKKKLGFGQTPGRYYFITVVVEPFWNLTVCFRFKKQILIIEIDIVLLLILHIFLYSLLYIKNCLQEVVYITYWALRILILQRHSIYTVSFWFVDLNGIIFHYYYSWLLIYKQHLWIFVIVVPERICVNWDFYFNLYILFPD